MNQELYWAADGTIRRTFKGGGTVTELFAPGSYAPRYLKVDDQVVYFLDGDQGLLAVPRAGGVPSRLRFGQITSLDAHSDHVYWTEVGCLGRMRSDGTEGRCLEEGTRFGNVRVDDPAVFYVRGTGPQEIVRRPKP